ncbi:MAG: acetolactate synthase small subunit [Oscillospiraceae bacterium]|jgi:acetolactate synthase-1/3 small subunit|nr:acetolactate synthase small subunit [Oscillospiraceae bacterium]MBQ9696407.1 acetolactate synthase small subunit [Oscillospiraceae bacterium]MBR1898193.1 acetolactate synthase small subunit [Oscillospiraceae bacterium]
MERYVIGILVDNQPGILTRVASMFNRRGFNIDCLSVSETEDPRYSRITIALHGDDSVRTQIVRQLRKLYNVQEVKVMERDVTVSRELALIKLRNSPETRQEILSAVDIFRSKIVDFSPNTLCVEITGETSKIEAFIALVEPLGILEMCRTGVVAIERGCHYLNSETSL